LAEPLRSTEIEAPAAGAITSSGAEEDVGALGPAAAAAVLDGGAPAPAPSRLGVLRHKHFRNVWAGAMVSNVGGWMEGVGVQWIIAHITQSPTMMATLAAAQLGPTLLLGLVGGIAADRVNRKKLLLVTQIAMMVIAAGLALTSYLSHAQPRVWILLMLSLAQGVALAFNTPAWQVLTPRLVPRAELTNAIALNGLQFNLARVVGPALAGALMAAYSPTILFVINTFTFSFVIGAIWTTPDAPAPPRNRRSVLHETSEALRFLFHERGPRAVFLASVVFATLAAPLMRMLPLFAHDVYAARDPLFRWIVGLNDGLARVLHLKASDDPREMVFGWLLSVMGAGAVAGAIGMRWVPRWYPKHHFIPLSILMGGMAIAAFSATRSLTLASVLLFAGGIAWLWAFNSSMAALQLLVPDAMRGRVMSVNNMAVFGAMPIGAYLASLIGNSAGSGMAPGASTQIGVGTLGAALAISGMVMLIWRTPEVDGMKPGDTGYELTPGLIRGITGSAHRPRRTRQGAD
jgi:MFS family permease